MLYRNIWGSGFGKTIQGYMGPVFRDIAPAMENQDTGR